MNTFERLYLGGMVVTFLSGVCGGLLLYSVAPELAYAAKTHTEGRTAHSSDSGTITPDSANMRPTPQETGSYGLVFAGADAEAIMHVQDLMTALPAAKRLTKQTTPTKPAKRDAALVEAFGEE